jgi:hypothetical protein
MHFHWSGRDHVKLNLDVKSLVGNLTGREGGPCPHLKLGGNSASASDHSLHLILFAQFHFFFTGPDFLERLGEAAGREE